MQHSGFVHLHVHSEYSLLDGANRIDKMLALAKKYKMPALAITDHGNMFGAVEFYLKANEYGIKPIIGCELYVANGAISDRDKSKPKPHHLILLCENEIGYKNLCKLASIASLEGFYYRPRIDKALLKEYNEGLIALSACIGGEVAGNIVRGNLPAAKEAALFYKDLFTDDRFYLEIQHNGMPEQERANKGLIELSKELDIPLVATNDCHYLEKKDSYAHEVLLCIQTGKTMEDDTRMKMQSDEFYFKSPEVMAADFKDTPEAIDNTVKIAERCNLDLKFGQFHLPDYKESVESGKIDKDMLTSLLIEKAKKGLDERLKSVKEKYKDDYDFKEKQYQDRFERELAIINSMGFQGYFLIVADFINYAKEHDIPVGPGRGSAAGSLIAYCMKITEVDPIEYHLLFERFLNPERKSMPDIDVDFCMHGRDAVISYVTEKYGKDNVAQIITFGKMQAKGVIRDVGRALNMPYGEVDKIAKLVPNILNITLKGAIAAEPKLKALIRERADVKKLIEIGQSLEGLKRHSSTHAAGIVISNKPLVEYLPLFKNTKDDEIMTQFSMKYVEKIGLVKFDFLGLKTLTVIAEAIKIIKRTHDTDIDINGITLSDEKTFKLLCDGDTNGVFQLESAGMKELMVKMGPDSFEDIIALVALYRPGPLQSGMVDDFIKRKNGEAQVKKDKSLPKLDKILSDTHGVIVYQEQVMQIASELAGYSLGDADILRRAMGKKDPDAMKNQRDKFISGAKANGINEKKATKIFNNMEKFAEYGFNKSHSAAYALIAYQTAYLKANYPVEFMASLLSAEMNDTTRIVKYIMECKDMGIDILPPDVNDSKKGFTVVDGRIRFGLAAVKNVGASAIESVIECRQDDGRFASIYDFCMRVDLRRVNKRVIESLIKCGAFDSFGVKRSQLMEVFDEALTIGQSHQRDKDLGQFTLFGGADSAPSYSEKYPDIEEFDESKILAFEKETLGFYVSGHPLLKHSDKIDKYATVDSSTINTSEYLKDLKMCGIITKLNEKITKRGERMAFAQLEDLYGSTEVLIFPEVYKAAESLLKSESPVLVTGDIDKNESSSKLIASNIIDLNDAEELIVDLVEIDVKHSDNMDEKLNRLKDVIMEYPGDVKADLLLNVEGKGMARIRMSERFNVRPGKDLKLAVKSIFGYDAVKLRLLDKKVNNNSKRAMR